jgi:hypothetical protein
MSLILDFKFSSVGDIYYFYNPRPKRKLLQVLWKGEKQKKSLTKYFGSSILNSEFNIDAYNPFVTSKIVNFSLKKSVYVNILMIFVETLIFSVLSRGT